MGEEANEEDLSSLSPTSSEKSTETDTEGVMLDLCVSRGQLGLVVEVPTGRKGPRILNIDLLY